MDWRVCAERQRRGSVVSAAFWCVCERVVCLLKGGVVLVLVLVGAGEKRKFFPRVFIWCVWTRLGL